MATKLLQTFYVICFVIHNVNSLINSKNERKIEGRIVVITGGAKGDGYAIADNFLKNGAKTVVILDKNVSKGKQAEKKLNSKYGRNKADFIECDVTKDLDTIPAIIKKKYGYTDILINCAAIFDEDKPRKVMLVNAIATIEFSLKFVDLMRKDKCGKGGTIMNRASVLAHTIDPFVNTYRASKFAVSGFSQSLGQDYNYKQTGVRVITLCPGPTNTTLGRKIYNSVSKKVITTVLNEYNYNLYLQDPDYVGKGAVEVFKIAETGTSWDIINEKPPFESSKTLKFVTLEE